MLDNIKQEQSKLDKLTNLISSHLTDTKKSISTLKSNLKHNKQEHGHSASNIKTYKNDINKLQDFKMYLDSEEHIKKQLSIDDDDLTNMPKETIHKILNILKNYINMDKSFRLKHETLKTLYISYLKLYKKYKDHKSTHKVKRISHTHKDKVKISITPTITPTITLIITYNR